MTMNNVSKSLRKLFLSNPLPKRHCTHFVGSGWHYVCSAAAPKGEVSVYLSRGKNSGVALGSKARAVTGLMFRQFCSPGRTKHLVRYLFAGH